jgi:hypothetical protein
VSGELHALEKQVPVPLGQEAADWAPEQVWKRWRRDKFPDPAGNRTPVVKPVV